MLEDIEDVLDPFSVSVIVMPSSGGIGNSIMHVMELVLQSSGFDV